MRGRTPILAGLTTVVVALTLWVSVPATAAITGTITLTISCATNPERTTITNNTDETLNLAQFTLTTIVNPQPGVEPITLSGTLAPGASVTFESGMGATTNPLNLAGIYDNEAAGEGVILSTPFGAVQVLCAAGTGTLQVMQQPASPTATAVPASPTATVAATATSAATPTIRPTATPLVTPAPTVAAPSTVPSSPPAPTATMVLPGMPRTGVGGAGLGLGVGPLAAIMAAIILFGTFVSRERRRR